MNPTGKFNSHCVLCSCYNFFWSLFFFLKKQLLHSKLDSFLHSMCNIAFLWVTSYRDCSRIIVMRLRNYLNHNVYNYWFRSVYLGKRLQITFNNKFLMWFHFHCTWPLYCLKSWSCCLRNCSLASWNILLSLYLSGGNTWTSWKVYFKNLAP